MKKCTFLFLAAVPLMFLTACNRPTVSLAPTEVPAGGEPTQTSPLPTETSEELLASATPNLLVVDPPEPGWVAYDFVAEICSATWSTNATYLPCPAQLDGEGGGYFEAVDQTIVEGDKVVEAPVLIEQPGKGYPVGIGLFAKYPPFTVYPGDTFQAVIACQGTSDCDVDFYLEYYPPGATRTVDWKWSHQAGDGPQEVSADLSSLAGQTVEFYLVLRPEDDLKDQWVVWIQPYIRRDPAAQPVPTQAVLPTPTVDPEDQTPGVISGMVDMASAPPYLKSSYGESNSSSPVAVVFFNLSDGTYWWIHTSLTGHPYYQMTVSPGEYQVVAYAHGVGDIPYVEGGYTGQNPSCGKNLKTITVPPNGRVENIVIADWNWTCGGTAYRPVKPDGVPLP